MEVGADPPEMVLVEGDDALRCTLNALTEEPVLFEQLRQLAHAPPRRAAARRSSCCRETRWSTERGRDRALRRRPPPSPRGALGEASLELGGDLVELGHSHDLAGPWLQHRDINLEQRPAAVALRLALDIVHPVELGRQPAGKGRSANSHWAESARRQGSCRWSRERCRRAATAETKAAACRARPGRASRPAHASTVSSSTSLVRMSGRIGAMTLST